MSLIKKEITDKIKKKWDSGAFLPALLLNEFEEYVISLKPLKESDYDQNLKRTMTYLKNIKESFTLEGIEIDYKETKFRSMGRQRFPSKIRITTKEALLKLLNKSTQYKLMSEKASASKAQSPALFRAICDNPTMLINNIDIWGEALKVVQYFQDGRHVAKYIRELDIQGVDTKFIEKNQKLIRWCLDQTLTDNYINREATKGNRVFERRFLLQYEKPRVRLRTLDPALNHDLLGFSDIEVPIDNLANLDHLLIDTLYITENKVSGLTFPKCRNSLVIFGKGYSIDALKNITWLHDVNIVYWGDIDTHGFSILSRLRTYFPKAKSLMMDIDTYETHKSLCVVEPTAIGLPENNNLTKSEKLLFDILSEGGRCHRLEQERIPFSYIKKSLKKALL